MDYQMLSSVLEKQLHSLCLKDFPCGHGSWKANSSLFKEQSWGYTEQDEGCEGADKEGQEALVDLLTCPHSPWQHTGSWSPQVPGLRQLSVQRCECLHDNFIYKYFRTLRIVDKGVFIIDDGLLKFSNLEELVLSANKISELQAEHLPCSLRVLELYANQVSSLKGLTHHQCPELQHLGLGSNRLGSQEDIQYFTGGFWPKLVSLDLSWCEFQEQQALVDALTTLPCLRTLVLEGNPLTLTPSYPGFIVDSLSSLLYLDASLITPEERHHFKGLAKMRKMIVDQAVATVSMGRIRGISDPHLSVDENTPEYPVISYSYFVTYEFLSNQPSADTPGKCDSSLFDKVATISHTNEDDITDVYQQSSKKYDNPALTHDKPSVLGHSTPKLTWAECMDFLYARSFIVDDLGSLKRFLNEGIWLRIEEEKVLSWPAPSSEVPLTKPTQSQKDKKPTKGKEAPVKAGSKDRKKKCVIDMVQDAPIRTVLRTVHVPLQDLVKQSQKVDLVGDLGFLVTEPSMRAMEPMEKDSAKRIKDDKKGDKKSKSGRDSTVGQKNRADSKGKGKGLKESEADLHIEDSAAAIQHETLSLEFTMQLEKWRSASEAHQLLLPQ